MKILVVRFRQMGDAILTTVVLNSLKKSFPDCSIDFVLNDKICPLFEGHPSINRLIPFTDALNTSGKYGMWYIPPITMSSST